jgi:hypothetical protein
VAVPVATPSTPSPPAAAAATKMKEDDFVAEPAQSLRKEIMNGAGLDTMGGGGVDNRLYNKNNLKSALSE